ncbi:glyoxylase-like metal-dependent hydrolase (beta-lactamase superfamily II) [Novosphingobium capsulatum]|uniref:Glyoxylase-like metal-dependent hydrolase (Beta-lactamase superfamily II) n=1 Tax=Novosphingobium capsulatum TaxID=13688 RepID=A0ABU1MKH9_9SPHN|nr:MBL fold metallo-hydrolase [Novosphingobium capsulatum]MDR6510843.1 glyoxylase-like metal-dependent hydrolase (beta-lactamase superfamily II) [Novosphingobium capsulatum]
MASSSLPDRSTWNTGMAAQLEPLVRRVLAPNPSPYTYTGTQTYIVGAGQDVAVIDPGPDGTGAAGHADTNGEGHVAAIVAAVGSARIAAIVCTHTHRDHSPASRPLAALTGAPIIGCAPLALDDDGPRADAAFDPDYRPARVLADGEVLRGDGWTLQAVATPGHTSNHLCLALVESGALFTGDHVMGWSTSVVSPPDGDMAAYMASLQKLYDRPQDRVYYPAHGDPIDNPHQFVRGMLGHRRQRERQVLRVLEGGLHDIPAMVAQMYKGLDPRLTGAAGRSVLAHLLDLERQGRVVRSGEQWTTAR